MAKRKHNSVNQSRSPRKKAKQATAPIERRVTRSMTTKATRQAVFDTTELMENILAHLTPYNALHAKKVCRRFNEIVTSSLPLHELLFLRPPPAQPPLRYRVVGDRPRCHFVVANGEADKAGTRVFDYRPLFTVIQRNPFLFDLDVDSRKLKARYIIEEGYDTLYMKFHLVQTLQGNFAGPINEPWVNMLISNPPITSACVRFEISLGDVACIQGASRPIQNANGLTMNDILGAAFNTTSGVDVRGYGLWLERDFDVREDVEPGLALSELVANLEEEYQVAAEWEHIEMVLDRTFVATEKEIKSIK